MATLNGWINGLYGNKETIDILEELNEHGIYSNRVTMNGELACQFYINHNHLGSSFSYFFKQLKKLIEIEDKEVHGLIYLYDDEDSEFHDTWQVWKICKRKIKKTTDSFLSPLSEKVFNFDD